MSKVSPETIAQWKRAGYDPDEWAGNLKQAEEASAQTGKSADSYFLGYLQDELQYQRANNRASAEFEDMCYGRDSL